MPQVARLGDRTMGSCTEHGPDIGGKIITGSPDVIVNGKPMARIGDKVLADCGHIATIVTGSPKEVANGKQVARITDKVGNSPYTAKIVTGSPNVIAD